MIVRTCLYEGGSVVESLVLASSTSSVPRERHFLHIRSQFLDAKAEVSLQFADDLIMMKPNACFSRANLVDVAPVKH